MPISDLGGVDHHITFSKRTSHGHRNHRAIIEMYCLWAFGSEPGAHDPEDAHVLEAAIASGTDHLVTFNTGDLAAAGEFGIEVLTPGEFLRAIE